MQQMTSGRKLVKLSQQRMGRMLKRQQMRPDVAPLSREWRQFLPLRMCLLSPPLGPGLQQAEQLSWMWLWPRKGTSWYAFSVVLAVVCSTEYE